MKTAGELAQEKLASMKVENDAKAEKQQEEARDASKGSPPEKEKTKDELVEEAGNKAVEKAKQDEEILAKKEEDLTEEEVTRKEEIAKAKTEKDNVDADSKETARKKKVEERIGGLVSDLKRLESEGKQKDTAYEKMETELKELKESSQPATIKDELNKRENERVTKYTEEDKGKPNAERREMSDEDLNEWLLEDMAAANRWLAKQERRREREMEYDARDHYKKESATEFVTKQKESLTKVISKHPELDISKRAQELKDEGKTQSEALSIILKENDKYRILAEINKGDDRETYLGVDGPEKAMAEMERRLKKEVEDKGNVKETDDEKAARLKKEKEDGEEAIREEGREQERQRQEDLDEGIGSTRNGDKKGEKEKSEFQKEQDKVAAKAKISPERLKEIKDRREKIPGAGEKVST